jgi:hypothetical protein
MSHATSTAAAAAASSRHASSPSGRATPSVFLRGSLLACCLVAAMATLSGLARAVPPVAPGKTGAAKPPATARPGANATSAPAPSFTLAGTAVGPDLFTPVPGARITVMPESTATYTDADGDFLLPWNGRDGWITVVPAERSRDGSEWCKRVVLRGILGQPHDPMVNLGQVLVTPRARLNYLPTPVMPSSCERPASIRAPGPRAGEPDTCRVYLNYAADLWGRITRVNIAGGDDAPAGLRTALFNWIESIPWIVAPETACGPAEPFQANKWMDYAWADTAWVKIAPPPSRKPVGSLGGDSRDR